MRSSVVTAPRTTASVTSARVISALMPHFPFFSYLRPSRGTACSRRWCSPNPTRFMPKVSVLITAHVRLTDLGTYAPLVLPRSDLPSSRTWPGAGPLQRERFRGPDGDTSVPQSTPVGAEVGLVWDVREASGDSLIAPWDVRSAVSDTLQLQWDVRSAVNDSLELRWDVRQTVGDNPQLVWDIRQALGDSMALRWDVRASAGKSAALVWDVRQAVGDSLPLLWDIQAAVVAVGKELGLVWRVRSTVGDSLVLVWDVEEPRDPTRLILKHSRARL